MKPFFVDLERTPVTAFEDDGRDFGLLVDANELDEAINLAKAFVHGMTVVMTAQNAPYRFVIVGCRNKPVRGKTYLPPKEFRL